MKAPSDTPLMPRTMYRDTPLMPRTMYPCNHAFFNYWSMI